MKSRLSRGFVLQSDAAGDDWRPQDPISKIEPYLAPCQPNHPFLTAHGLQEVDVQVYTGILDINGVQCHGSIAIPIFNIDAQQVSFALLAKTGNRNYTAMLLPEIEWTGCFARIGTPSDTLLLAIDWASGMSAHITTGHAVAVALHESNLLSVCKNIAEKYPAKKIIICDDLQSTQARTVSLSVAEEMAIPLALPYQSPDQAIESQTFNSLHRNMGPGTVCRNINAAVAPSTSEWSALVLDREIARLSFLSEAEYEQQRSKSAKRFDVRASFLDKKVDEAREWQMKTNHLSAEHAVDPYPHAVKGMELFEDLINTIRRFTVLTPNASLTVALWIIFTHVIDRVSVAPILGLMSPVKRCGKTTLITLLGHLCFRPTTTSNITPAALYRYVHRQRPTLLIDEADTFIHGSSALNGIINSGHTRSAASVMRTVEGRSERFSTFCAKAVALIGQMPETMQDRAIPVTLRRKRSSEKVESIRSTPDAELLVLKAKILRWTSDNATKITATSHKVEGVFNDRAVDNWEPLLVIASCLSDKCLAAAETAARELSDTNAQSPSLTEELLADLEEAFEDAKSERLASSRIIQFICRDDEKPWATYDKGRPITSRQLAALLAVFGIKSKNLRVSAGEVIKGYERSAFSDAFSRYIGTPTP